MHEIAQLIGLLVALYATVGIMAVGFGMMLRGPDGAAAAGRFFFVRPLQWAGRQVCVFGVVGIAATWRFVLHRIVDSFILAVERVVIWLVTRERGWVRRR